MKTLIILFICLMGFIFFHHGVVKEPDGILVTRPPLQEIIESKIVEQNMISDTPYKITAVATYDIKARVLKRERYYSDFASKFSPLDLALGWQEMSSNELIKMLNISQGNRFYFWHTKNPLAPIKAIQTESANTHIIPANAEIKKEVLNIKEGEIIELKGYLVNVQAFKTISNSRGSVTTNAMWRTSLTREDTGDGACEIMYVEEVVK